MVFAILLRLSSLFKLIVSCRAIGGGVGGWSRHRLVQMAQNRLIDIWIWICHIHGHATHTHVTQKYIECETERKCEAVIASIVHKLSWHDWRMKIESFMIVTPTPTLCIYAVIFLLENNNWILLEQFVTDEMILVFVTIYWLSSISITLTSWNVTALEMEWSIEIRWRQQ